MKIRAQECNSLVIVNLLRTIDASQGRRVLDIVRDTTLGIERTDWLAQVTFSKERL